MTNLFNSLTLTQKQLLTLVKGGLWGNASGTDLFEKASYAEWEEVAELAAVQGVLGIAYDGMKELPQSLHPPKNILIKWALGVEAIEKRHQYQIKALQSLATLFKENNIRCLLLKGPGLGQLYPIPAHRESGDLDIYLFGDYAKGNHLMEERGIKVEYTGEIHSKFFFEGIPVENHRTFIHYEGVKANLEFEMLLHQELSPSQLSYSQESGIYFPSLSFNLLYILKHNLRHFLREGFILRQICDWTLILHQCRSISDSYRFYEVVKRFDLQRYANVFSLIASEYLGLPENLNIAIYPEPSFAEKVFKDLMNQKRKDYFIFSESSITMILKRILNRTILLYRSRWKYNAINRKMFFIELKIRIGEIPKIFNKA